MKIASLGSNGTFQFNHVCLNRTYNYRLSIGIDPTKSSSMLGTKVWSPKAALVP